MSEDAKLFAITGFGGGVSIGIKADNFAEFEALAKQVYGEAQGQVFAHDVFGSLLQYAPSAQAVQVVSGAVGPVTIVDPANVPPNNVVPFQPVQQPNVQQQPPSAALPPYPGDCSHGPRNYKSSMARGKQWNRYECAIPWSQGVQGRCQAVNV